MQITIEIPDDIAHQLANTPDQLSRRALESLVVEAYRHRQISTAQVHVTGLLGVLYRAGTQDIIDFPNAISKLQLTTFRASSALIQSFLDRYYQE